MVKIGYMEIFPLPLVVEALDDDGNWKITEPFASVDPVLGRADDFLSRVTDFGSIPKLARAIVNPVGFYRKPYANHDRNYTEQELNGKPLTQKDCDDCLLRQMREADAYHNAQVPKWRVWSKSWGVERMTIYLHLRAYGWAVWGAHKREKARREA